jgi:hypothetical protein
MRIESSLTRDQMTHDQMIRNQTSHDQIAHDQTTPEPNDPTNKLLLDQTPQSPKFQIFI